MLATKGLTVKAATQSPTDGYVYMTACDASGGCGIYEGLIDGAGEFVVETFKKIAATGWHAPMAVVAGRHPVTGSTIVFSNRGTSAIDV